MKHPRYDDFKYEIIERLPNGSRYITAENLPGFRLVVHANEDMETEISEALTVFLPLHENAEKNGGYGDLGVDGEHHFRGGKFVRWCTHCDLYQKRDAEDGEWQTIRQHEGKSWDGPENTP